MIRSFGEFGTITPRPGDSSLLARIQELQERVEQRSVELRAAKSLTVALVDEARQAEKRSELTRQQMAAHTAERHISSAAEIGRLRSDLFDRESQIAGLSAQLATVKTQLARRWWQWRK